MGDLWLRRPIRRVVRNAFSQAVHPLSHPDKFVTECFGLVVKAKL